MHLFYFSLISLLICIANGQTNAADNSSTNNSNTTPIINVTRTCYGQAYAGFERDIVFFSAFYEPVNCTILLVASFLLVLLICVSIFGDFQNGEYRWFVLNIAALHLLWIVLYEILHAFSSILITLEIVDIVNTVVRSLFKK